MERKRNTWSEEETIFFLELLKQNKILQILDGKRFKAAEVYKALEKEMIKSGYKKDANMMKTKFKNLKADYYKAKKHNSQSGVDPRYCPYFEILDELLGDRPAVAMDGVDTSLTYMTEQESEKEENEREEQVEQLQSTEDDSFQGIEIPEGHFELSDDGYLSPSTEALPEGVPSTSDGKTSTSSLQNSEQSKTPKSFRSVTPSRNSIDILLEVKESIQESLKKLTEREEKEDEFLDKFLKGQSQLLKEMTNNFIEGIGSLFKRRKRKYYSSSTDSESEEEKRKKKK